MTSDTAVEALSKVQALQKQQLEAEFGGKASNRFVEEVKSSALFNCNWGELLSAAPTALSLMGSCWIAASQEKAEQILLGKARPVDGFKYLPNRADPTLRSCLVDVCNNGGSRAFKLAGCNMDILRTKSYGIFGPSGRIEIVFLRLPGCTKSAAHLEDFQDALTDLADDANDCAEKAAEIREAFETWGKMVGELHATVEQKYGTTSVEAEKTTVEEKVKAIEETFALDNKKDSDNAVQMVAKKMEQAEKRLDRAMDNVPGPWATVLAGASTAFAQSVPSIVAGVLPAVLAANPATAIGMALNPAARQNAAAGAGAQNSGTGATGSTPEQASFDTACDHATALLPYLNNFYAFLGGDKGTVDWTKFDESVTSTTETGSESRPQEQGISYLLGSLKGIKAKHEPSGTEASIKVAAGNASSLTVAEDIQRSLEGKRDMNAEEVPPTVITKWKKDIKDARDICLGLSAASNLTGSTSVPNPFANANIKIPPTDYSAQKSQLSTAMQGVQMAQQALDLAQDKYDLAIKKQEEMQKALLQVQTKLKSLREQGKTLENIKSVLRDCISVLVDLTVQISKLERFFTMLKNLINELIVPKVKDFVKLMGKAGNRSHTAGQITIDNISKQLIYTATLQIKAYFSLLYDIADMYCDVDKKYIVRGMELCAQLSKQAAVKGDTTKAVSELNNYTEESTTAITKLVNESQQKMLKELKTRAQKAQETTKLIEDTSAQAGIEVDSLKAAVGEGARAVKEGAKKLLESSKSATESLDNTEDVELTNL